MKYIVPYRKGEFIPPGSAVLCDKYRFPTAGTILAIATIIVGFSFYALGFYFFAT